ncbi:hypothetical protein DF268_11820 [Streptomyces sp. V2]|uniref:Lipoprotein n=1 Tax=Streptomyces niveiscabiei TaxID=164115 RepID=A0ABW9I7V3_9ACTN|nr:MULTISPECIES: hypothetical protein [Streptomyces]PWG13350.1 hypothetical protein DF268_11820 [Streptomyces sp. V2]
MSVRTPWWLNLIALVAAIAPCAALGLPWYAAAVAALATGIIADRVWEAILRRRGHDQKTTGGQR